MLEKLLLFLSLLNISQAELDLNKKKELVLYLNNDQLDLINENLNSDDSSVREIMTKYTQSLQIDGTTGDYKLVIRFS